AKNVDEKKKDTLKYLKSIGFDLLPQSLTNQLITEYQSNIFNIPGLNLNKKTLDISNGRFGESDIEQGGDKWKDNLIKFMEKAIYGEIGAEGSIFGGKQFKGEFGASIDPLDLNNALEQGGIKTRAGWNINIIRGNLEKEVVVK
ncbi:MAG: hypothetical protein QM490_00465, partial [Candidatus Gracilibacteria bacterium]